jgi:hypothetical protein
MSVPTQKQGSFPIPTFTDIKNPNSNHPMETKNPDGSITEVPGSPDAGTSATPLLRKERPFQFIATKRFWVVLVLGQILSWCIVSTNTTTQYLAIDGANIPAFQTLFNYVLLAFVYTSWTLWKYGFKKWGLLLWKDGWKYFILAFVDVQGVIYLEIKGLMV